MAPEMHSSAPHYMPSFITAPGEPDILFNVAVGFLLTLIILIGNLYLRLHAIPEKIAHQGTSKLQFQIVAVLALIALFTHNNLYWIAALLLALIRLPDFETPLVSIAQSMGRIAARRPSGADEVDEGEAESHTGIQAKSHSSPVPSHLQQVPEVRSLGHA